MATIADKLGSLPLALDLIRHYLLSTGSSYSQFLENYSRFDETFLFQDAGFIWQNQWYPASIAATFTYRLQQMSENAVLMMHMLSILDPNSISVSFFKAEKSKMCVDFHRYRTTLELTR